MKDKNLLSELLNNALTNSVNSALNAYPQLRDYVGSVQRTLAGIVETTIIEEADLELSGDAPWAMLYTLNYGRKICIPDRRSVLQSPNVIVPCGHIHHVPDLRSIVDYMLTHRNITEMGFMVSAHLPETEIIINAQENWGKIRFDNNDMTLFIPKLHSTIAHVECPLFDVPREVLLNAEWMIENITKPLHIELTGVPYDRRLSPEMISRHLIIDHYFTEQGENKLAGDHPYNVLYDIMDRGQFRNQPSIANKACPNNGYTAMLEFKKNLYVVIYMQDHPNRSLYMKVLTIGRVFTVVDGVEKSMTQWYENPLLVRDIEDEMDDILNRLVASQA